jgi:hypothetical protein
MKYTHTRTVKADKDEWIHVDRSSGSDDGLGAILFLLAGIGIVYIVIKIIIFVVGVVLGITILCGLLYGIYWLNRKAWKVFSFDLANKLWIKMSLSCALWAVLSLTCFGWLKPLIVEMFTTRTIIEEGMWWWKTSRTVESIDRSSATLVFIAYWVSVSLPFYAVISLVAQFIIKNCAEEQKSEPKLIKDTRNYIELPKEKNEPNK